MLVCWAQGENTVVSLIMSRAAYTDSGNYTCAPDNAPLASIQLHIIDGTNRYCYITVDPAMPAP
jgi:hypothetical protein